MIRKGLSPGSRDELSKLLASEREPPRLSEPQRAQLIARVLARAAPHARRPPWWQRRQVRSWGLGLSFVAFGGVVWAAGQAAFSRAPEPARLASGAPMSSGVAPVHAPLNAAEPTDEAPMLIPEPAAVPPADAVPRTAHAPTPDPKRGATVREDELAALNEARAAQQRGDAAGALRAIVAHEKRFPRSIFAEDREALRVVALGKLGRTSEAEARARAFAKRYPRSVFISKLSAWLAD